MDMKIFSVVFILVGAGVFLGIVMSVVSCIKNEAERTKIENTPDTDVAEVRHGEWIKVADLCGIEVLKCSVCGMEHPRTATAFCCDCGAKMDKAKSTLPEYED